MEPSKVHQLKQSVDEYDRDHSILTDPSLHFFRDFLRRLGAKISATPTSSDATISGKTKESPTTVPAAPNDVAIDDVNGTAEDGQEELPIGVPSSDEVDNNSLYGAEVINKAVLCYLGWKDHGIKSRKEFNSNIVRYESVARWLKAYEVCCMLLNPDDFDKFKANGDHELGAFIIEKPDLDNEMKGAKTTSYLYEVGSCNIRVDAFNKSGDVCISALVEGCATTRHLIQRRRFIRSGHYRCMDISPKLGDQLEDLHKRLLKFVEDNKK